MAEDRGGLRYNINVGGDWREEISDFRSQIRDVRKDASQARRSRDTRGRRVNSDELKRQEREQRRLTETQKLRARALREYNKETERQEVAARKAEVAERQRFRVEQRRLSQLEIEQQALRRNTSALNNAKVAEERWNKVLARTGKITEDVARQHGILSEFRRRQRQEAARLTQQERTLERATARLTRELEKQAEARAIAEEISRRNLRNQLSTRQLQQLGQLSVIPPARTPRRTQQDAKAPENLAQRLTRLKEQFRSLVPAVLTADSSVNRISFTFRRLFGILAAFAAARLAINTIRDLVRGVIEFNSNIEQSRLGIASLIAAVADLRTPQGEIVKGSAAIALAQREANRQTALLRAEALKTAATFDQLAETFQVALAPGLQAGLALDEVRKFTVRIAQAAASIGLEQNQLAEEIRSILSGTIQARTTRIAVALGITNADIRRVREAGTLFQFLEERFAAFEAAGNEAVNTFAAITTNLKDAFFFVTSIGTADVFQTFKETLQGIIDLLVTRDPITENIIPTPEALRGAKELARIFEAIVDEVTRVSANFGIDGFVGVLRSIRSFLEPVIKILGGVVEGVLEGFGVVRDVIREIFKAVNNVTGINVFDPDSLEGIRQTFKEWAKIIATVVALWLVFSNTVLPLINLGFAYLVTLGAKFVKSILLGKAVFASEAAVIEKFGAKWGAWLIAIRGTLGSIAKALGRIGVLFTIFRTALKESFDYATGMDLKLETIGKLLRDYFSTQFVVGIKKLRALWLRFAEFMTTTLQKAIQNIVPVFITLFQFLIRQVNQFLRTLVNSLGPEGKNTLFGKVATTITDQLALVDIALSLGQRKLAKSAGSVLDPAIKAIQKDRRDLAKEIEGLERDQLLTYQKILEQSGKDSSIPSLLGDVLSVIGQRLFGTDFDTPIQIPIGIEGVDQLRVTAKDILSDLTGVFVSSRPPLEDLSDEAKNFADNLQQVQDQLDIDAASRGLSGVASQIAKEATKARLTEQKTIQKLQKEQETLNRLIAQANDIRNEASGQLENLPQREAEAARQVQEILDKRKSTVQELLEAQRKGLKTEENIVDAIKEILRTTDDQLGSFVVGQNIEADTLKLILRKNIAMQEIAKAQKNINLSIEDENRVRRESNRLTLRQLELVARQSQDIAKQSQLDEVELKFESASLRAESLPEFQARAVLAQAELDRAKELARIRQEQAFGEQGNITQLSKRIDLLQKGVEKQRAYNAELRAKGELSTTDELDILEAEAADLAGINQLEELRTQLTNQYIIAQLRAGIEIERFKKKYEEATSLMRMSIKIVKDDITNFASTASDAIVDAFDPSKTVNFRTVLADFFAALAKQLLTLILQATVFRAILSSISLLGFSDGGAVGPTQSSASASGFARGGRVRGFAGGGSVGALDPRDRIPAMLRVGEYVIRPEAVSMYGHRLLNSINSMQLDPAAIVPPARPSRTAPSQGKATGGPVIGADRGPAPSASSQGNNGVSVAVVVPNDESLDRMLRGGKPAFLKFLAEYRGEINGQLGR